LVEEEEEEEEEEDANPVPRELITLLQSHRSWSAVRLR
jgi:hypothetical protein